MKRISPLLALSATLTVLALSACSTVKPIVAVPTQCFVVPPQSPRLKAKYAKAQREAKASLARWEATLSGSPKP